MKITQKKLKIPVQNILKGYLKEQQKKKVNLNTMKCKN